jgi:hypothetical protein
MRMPGFSAELALQSPCGAHRQLMIATSNSRSASITPQFWYCHAAGVAVAKATGDEWIGFAVAAGCVLAHFL